LVEGEDHRVAGDAEVGGQSARGRQALARTEAARQDRRAEAVVYLTVEREGRRGIEVQHESDAAGHAPWTWGTRRSRR
jgi:hypothetical protein